MGRSCPIKEKVKATFVSMTIEPVAWISSSLFGWGGAAADLKSAWLLLVGLELPSWILVPLLLLLLSFPLLSSSISPFGSIDMTEVDVSFFWWSNCKTFGILSLGPSCARVVGFLLKELPEKNEEDKGPPEPMGFPLLLLLLLLLLWAELSWFCILFSALYSFFRRILSRSSNPCCFIKFFFFVDYFLFMGNKVAGTYQ